MNAQELYELAMKHIYGEGVPEDNELAVKLLTQAHDMGHVEATYNLGICYHYGYGTGEDLAKAYEMYLKSANGGYNKATEYPDGVTPKKKQLAAYLIKIPSVSNKIYIARQLGIDRTTAQKYYDEVRAEPAALAMQ